MLVPSVNDKDLLYRYFVVEYHVTKRGNIEYDEKGLFKNVLCIHHLLHSYHWLHIDENHVLVVGRFHHGHHAKLSDRVDISMLPMIYSNKKLSVVLKSSHWNALKNRFSLDDTAITSDLVDMLVEQGKSIFAPSL